jgi:hypothetical protein
MDDADPDDLQRRHARHPSRPRRPVRNRKDLVDPAFKGKTAILSIPGIGIMDAAIVMESLGRIKYGDKGNMTRAEIDTTIAFLIETKKAGQFRAFWKTFDESVNLMASDEVIIQSMWSLAVAAVRSKGISCVYQPLAEGYRVWEGGLAIAKHMSGLELDDPTDRLLARLFSLFHRAEPHPADDIVRGLHGAFPHLEHHPHDLVGTVPWRAADHRARRCRHRAVRLHAVVRRIRPHTPDRGERQHAAAGNLRHDDEHRHAGAVCAGHAYHALVGTGASAALFGVVLLRRRRANRL